MKRNKIGTLRLRIKNKICRIFDYINNEIKYFFLDCGFVRLVKRKKKLIGFYGECHMYIYGAALLKCRDLKKKYVLLGGKEIEYLARWYGKQINKKSAWNHLDILIYNTGVPERLGAPTLKDIMDWLPDNCQKIEVTNAAFKGYMPQHTERVFKNNGFFIWGDKNLNTIIDTGDTENSHVDNYTVDYINGYFDKAIKHMKLYERKCTVQIADYIEKYGRDRVLYYSVTHPETEIMLEITRRILECLGIKHNLNDSFLNNSQFDLHSHGEVVYPSVFKALGIKGNPFERIIQPGNYKDLQYTFEQYICEYVKMGKEATTGNK